MVLVGKRETLAICDLALGTMIDFIVFSASFKGSLHAKLFIALPLNKTIPGILLLRLINSAAMDLGHTHGRRHATLRYKCNANIYGIN